MINFLLMNGNHFFIVVRKIVLNLITLRLSKHNKNRKKGIIIVFFQILEKTIVLVFLNNNFFTETV